VRSEPATLAEFATAMAVLVRACSPILSPRTLVIVPRQGDSPPAPAPPGISARPWPKPSDPPPRLRGQRTVDRRGKDPPRGLRPVRHLRGGGRALPLPPSGPDGRGEGGAMKGVFERLRVGRGHPRGGVPAAHQVAFCHARGRRPTNGWKLRGQCPAPRRPVNWYWATPSPVALVTLVVAATVAGRSEWSREFMGNRRKPESGPISDRRGSRVQQPEVRGRAVGIRKTVGMMRALRYWLATAVQLAMAGETATAQSKGLDPSTRMCSWSCTLRRAATRALRPRRSSARWPRRTAESYRSPSM
jgi:hypothetical protein